MSNIKLFKLVTGQDIIATLKDTTDTVYKIEKALMLMMQPSEAPNGPPNISFGTLNHPGVGRFDGQLQPNDPPTLELNRGAVMFVYEPTDDLASAYSQATGTIQLATSMPTSPR